ncbi:hypothetical protein M422DRAFT_780240 [Sphaerobolus stellatus SS14]|uniref:Uncharacterized protein n=1 Tax=Sphaerobolus stellatus (strain SS14) TaxID=990650 RepID=A0A0C9VJB7_SPHS4|nr:hypothetical protein M422DRAFT_780240 [Sphaerobolus stellatus SS14]
MYHGYHCIKVKSKKWCHRWFKRSVSSNAEKRLCHRGPGKSFEEVKANDLPALAHALHLTTLTSYAIRKWINSWISSFIDHNERRVQARIQQVAAADAVRILLTFTYFVALMLTRPLGGIDNVLTALSKRQSARQHSADTTIDTHHYHVASHSPFPSPISSFVPPPMPATHEYAGVKRASAPALNGAGKKIGYRPVPPPRRPLPHPPAANPSPPNATPSSLNRTKTQLNSNSHRASTLSAASNASASNTNHTATKGDLSRSSTRCSSKHSSRPSTSASASGKESGANPIIPHVATRSTIHICDFAYPTLNPRHTMSGSDTPKLIRKILKKKMGRRHTTLPHNTKRDKNPIWGVGSGLAEFGMRWSVGLGGEGGSGSGGFGAVAGRIGEGGTFGAAGSGVYMSRDDFERNFDDLPDAESSKDDGGAYLSDEYGNEVDYAQQDDDAEDGEEGEEGPLPPESTSPSSIASPRGRRRWRWRRWRWWRGKK